MSDIMTYIMHPYSEDPDKLERILELQGWDENIASVKAMREGLILTDEHLSVVEYLQSFYIENGWPDNARQMARIMDDDFSEQGGKRFLYQLFPKAPLTQATHIAGLPTLPETDQKSQGYEL